MARKSKPPESDGGLTIHTTFRVPRELHERLKKAAAEVEGRGIGDEIRRRLDASFAPSPSVDPTTNDLMGAIAEIAADVWKFYYHPWHADPFAFVVFKKAVDLLLVSHQPKGDPVPNLKPDSYAELLWGPEHSPENIASTFVFKAMPQARKTGDA
jgi:hypothetical protein